MLKQVALYIKMISYYEEKLQHLKQTLHSNHASNIELGFKLLSDNTEFVNKNNLLNFFVLNLQPINYKDVVEILWIIGSRGTFIANYEDFKYYITTVLDQQQNQPELHTTQIISQNLVQLLLYQLRIYKETREKRMQILSSPEFNIEQIFTQLSGNSDNITQDTMKSFMKKNNIKFSTLDFNYLSFSVFHNEPNIDHDQFRLSNLFSLSQQPTQQIQIRDIPNESIPQIEMPELQNHKHKFMKLEQPPQIMKLQFPKLNLELLKNASFVELQVDSQQSRKERVLSKCKKYIEQTYLP